MLIAAALLTTGCGGSSGVDGRPAVYPVSIRILYNDQPVEDATVTLQSQGDSDAAAYGRTDAAGLAEITTFEQGDGAVEGEHLVRIRKVEVETGPDPDADLPGATKIVRETHLTPQKYERFETSGLTITVNSSGANTPTLELTD